jgi:hypothetical protein
MMKMTGKRREGKGEEESERLVDDQTSSFFC